MKSRYIKLMYTGSVLLIIGFIVRIVADWFQYNPAAYSAPFYVFILVRAAEFLLPSFIIFLIAKLLKKK